MRLVAYLRVSSDTQLDGFGLDTQREAITTWAKRAGHTVVAWCADEGLSGTLPADQRPGLTDALGMIRRPPEADGLVAAKLDRLARQLTVQEAVLALVWREGGRMFTAEAGEVLADDPDDPMRTAMRQVQGVFAQLDRATVVKRMRDGRKTKAATGKKATGSYAYGTRAVGDGRERDAGPHPEEQHAVRFILDRRDAGDSYREIATALDELASRDPESHKQYKPRRAASWSAMSVRSVAQRHGLS